MSEKMDIPEKERAIVLQGGGSLGAYEAGAYRALYESLKKTLLYEKRIWQTVMSRQHSYFRFNTITHLKSNLELLLSRAIVKIHF
jgi:hypothetical protein